MFLSLRPDPYGGGQRVLRDGKPAVALPWMYGLTVDEAPFLHPASNGTWFAMVNLSEVNAEDRPTVFATSRRFYADMAKDDPDFLQELANGAPPV